MKMQLFLVKSCLCIQNARGMGLDLSSRSVRTHVLLPSGRQESGKEKKKTVTALRQTEQTHQIIINEK